MLWKIAAQKGPWKLPPLEHHMVAQVSLLWKKPDIVNAGINDYRWRLLKTMAPPLATHYTALHAW